MFLIYTSNHLCWPFQVFFLVHLQAFWAGGEEGTIFYIPYYTVVQWYNYGSCLSSFLIVPNTVCLFDQCWSKISKNYPRYLQRPIFCMILANSAPLLNMYNKDFLFSMLENALLHIFQTWISSAILSCSHTDFYSFHLPSATGLVWGDPLPTHFPSPTLSHSYYFHEAILESDQLSDLTYLAERPKQSLSAWWQDNKTAQKGSQRLG